VEAVDELKFRFPQQSLPVCKRAHGRHFSSNTGAYSRARSRLELDTAQLIADHVCDTLSPATPPSLGARRCFAFDCSTVLLQPEPALLGAFPGASNQHGESPFPVLHLALAHEMGSGMALRPQYGAKYGPKAVGEVPLAAPLLGRLPQRSIVLGDQNFGIFAFAWEAHQAGYGALLRLTKARFGALVKKGRPLGPGRWRLNWRPSKAERRKHPELPEDAQLSGWLMAQEVEHPEQGELTLYLFSTEEMGNEQ